jgi:hypothetical protein
LRAAVQALEIVENGRLAYTVVARRSGEATPNHQPEQTVMALRQAGLPGDRYANRRGYSFKSSLRSRSKSDFGSELGTRPILWIVRFARFNILIYDEHVIDLYELICAPYLIA